MTGAEIVGQLKITAVFQALGGEVRNRRGRAFWRDGDGWNVTLDDAKGTWFDHRDSVGGGMVDLVITARGGDRRAAIEWLADLEGVALDDQHSGPRIDLSAAENWRAGLLIRIGERLDACKVRALALVNPEEWTIAEITSLTRIEADLKSARNVRDRYRIALDRNRALALEVAREGAADRADAEEWTIACVRFLELAESELMAVAA